MPDPPTISRVPVYDVSRLSRAGAGLLVVAAGLLLLAARVAVEALVASGGLGAADLRQPTVFGLGYRLEPPAWPWLIGGLVIVTLVAGYAVALGRWLLFGLAVVGIWAALGAAALLLDRDPTLLAVCLLLGASLGGCMLVRR